MQLNFLYFPLSIQQDVISNNNSSSETVFSVKQTFFLLKKKCNLEIINWKMENCWMGYWSNIPYYIPPSSRYSIKSEPNPNIIFRGNVVCILIIDFSSFHPHPNKTSEKLLTFMDMFYVHIIQGHTASITISYRTKLKLYQHFHVSFFAFIEFFFGWLSTLALLILRCYSVLAVLYTKTT